MKDDFRDLLADWPKVFIRDADLAMALKKTADARYAIVKRAVKEGLSKTGEVLSARFTQVKTSEESDVVLLKVKNILNLKSYNKVLKYLNNLNVVKQIQAEQITSSDVVFKINSRSGRLGVAQAIDLGHMLVTDMTRVISQGVNKEPETKQLKTDLIYKLVQ